MQKLVLLAVYAHLVKLAMVHPVLLQLLLLLLLVVVVVGLSLFPLLVPHRPLYHHQMHLRRQKLRMVMAQGLLCQVPVDPLHRALVVEALGLVTRGVPVPPLLALLAQSGSDLLQ